MDTKFTKGEWFIENYDSMLDVAAKGHGSICTVDCDYQTSEWLIDPTDEQQANAHLIASAPDMYDFIESLLGVEYLSMEHDEITSLLKKARGES